MICDQSLGLHSLFELRSSKEFDRVRLRRLVWLDCAASPGLGYTSLWTLWGEIWLHNTQAPLPLVLELPLKSALLAVLLLLDALELVDEVDFVLISLFFEATEAVWLDFLAVPFFIAAVCCTEEASWLWTLPGPPERPILLPEAFVTVSAFSPAFVRVVDSVRFPADLLDTVCSVVLDVVERWVDETSADRFRSLLSVLLFCFSSSILTLMASISFD